MLRICAGSFQFTSGARIISPSPISESTHCVAPARSTKGGLPMSESRAVTSVEGSTPTTCPGDALRVERDAAAASSDVGIGGFGGVVCASTGSGLTGAWPPPAACGEDEHRTMRNMCFTGDSLVGAAGGCRAPGDHG